MFFVGAFALGGLAEKECAEGNPVLAIALYLVLAVIHSGFSYYVQWRIWEAVVKKMQEYDQQQAQSKKAPAANLRREVMKEAIHVLLYDVGVCLYIFFFFAAWAVNGWCYSQTCGSAALYIASTLLMLWHMCVIAFIFCWYCCNCCMSEVDARMPLPQSQKQQVATSFGASLQQRMVGQSPSAKAQQQPQQGVAPPPQATQPQQQGIPVVQGTVPIVQGTPVAPQEQQGQVAALPSNGSPGQPQQPPQQNSSAGFFDQAAGQANGLFKSLAGGGNKKTSNGPTGSGPGVTGKGKE